MCVWVGLQSVRQLIMRYATFYLVCVTILNAMTDVAVTLTAVTDMLFCLLHLIKFNQALSVVTSDSGKDVINYHTYARCRSSLQCSRAVNTGSVPTLN